MGSEDGTQLSHFMRENENSISVVLLDEFDHCDSETWEAFYHVFDEGKNLFLMLLPMQFLLVMMVSMLVMMMAIL